MGLNQYRISWKTDLGAEDSMIIHAYGTVAALQQVCPSGITKGLPLLGDKLTIVVEKVR
jgi:hypothetical protein